MQLIPTELACFGTIALVGPYLSIASPATAALFGASLGHVLALSKTTSERIICHYAKIPKDNHLASISTIGLTCLLSVGASWAICNAVGLPIAFGAAIRLTLTAVGLLTAATIVSCFIPAGQSSSAKDWDC